MSAYRTRRRAPAEIIAAGISVGYVAVATTTPADKQ
jgi:hypothetical protein